MTGARPDSARQTIEDVVSKPGNESQTAAARPAGPKGLVIAAPASGSGKTTIALGLLRALRDTGVKVASAKVGPDYIDPGFHAAAGGRACLNLDPWAMRPESLAFSVQAAGAGADLLIVEGVMGLFDGAVGGGGSTADLAHMLGLPIVLVMDVKGQSVSAAAELHGFRSYRPDIEIAGVILNRVGGENHVIAVCDAIAALSKPPQVLGAVPVTGGIETPSRHLGLVQAQEIDSLERMLTNASIVTRAAVDLEALQDLAQPIVGGAQTEADRGPLLNPLGQRIAVAQDAAFGFSYPGVLEAWRAQGADIAFFSPLADEGPDADADAVFLPGGYPELHAARLASCSDFLEGLQRAAARGAFLYGECGGYMALGEGLVDPDGDRHAMAGLLPIETSFAAPKRRLGYREIALCGDTRLGAVGDRFAGHEFHYAAETLNKSTAALFNAADSSGAAMGPAGAIADPSIGAVAGSFLHLIDRRP